MTFEQFVAKHEPKWMIDCGQMRTGQWSVALTPKGCRSMLDEHQRAKSFSAEDISAALHIADQYIGDKTADDAISKAKAAQ